MFARNNGHAIKELNDMVEIVDKAESLIAYEFSLTQQSTFDDVGGDKVWSLDSDAS